MVHDLGTTPAYPTSASCSGFLSAALHCVALAAPGFPPGSSAAPSKAWHGICVKPSSDITKHQVRLTLKRTTTTSKNYLVHSFGAVSGDHPFWLPQLTAGDTGRSTVDREPLLQGSCSVGFLRATSAVPEGSSPGHKGSQRFYMASPCGHTFLGDKPHLYFGRDTVACS